MLPPPRSDARNQALALFRIPHRDRAHPGRPMPAAVRDHHHEAEQVALEANPVVAPVGVPSPEVHSGTIGHRTEGCAERVRTAFVDGRLACAYPLGVGANNAGRA